MKNIKTEPIDIYNFFDYREYLRAVYDFQKKQQPGFSHRAFSSDAGISSPNYLFRILKGDRNLSSDYAANFCKALRLNKNEARYFNALVQFNSENGATAKEKQLRDLLTLRYRKGISRIDDKKLQFFGKWYYPVIRELAVIIDCKCDFNLLARNCVPRITAQQAGSALAYLIKTGFLQQDPGGAFRRTEPLISSGDEVKSTVLRNYHRQTLSQSIQALDDVALEDRDISSLTLSVSQKTFVAMKKEIQDFRKRLLAMAKEDKNPEMVCLTGFQLIPRSKINSAKKVRGKPI